MIPYLINQLEFHDCLQWVQMAAWRIQIFNGVLVLKISDHIENDVQ